MKILLPSLLVMTLVLGGIQPASADSGDNDDNTLFVIDPSEGNPTGDAQQWFNQIQQDNTQQQVINQTTSPSVVEGAGEVDGGGGGGGGGVE